MNKTKIVFAMALVAASSSAFADEETLLNVGTSTPSLEMKVLVNDVVQYSKVVDLAKRGDTENFLRGDTEDFSTDSHSFYTSNGDLKLKDISTGFAGRFHYTPQNELFYDLDYQYIASFIKGEYEGTYLPVVRSLTSSGVSADVKVGEEVIIFDEKRPVSPEFIGDKYLHTQITYKLIK
ncbi:TPA: hypothetical protein ACPVZG_000226 [Vibrio parahaemolyticus]